MIWKVLFDIECPLCCKFSNLIRNMDTSGNFILESYQHYSLNNAVPSKEILSTEVHIISNNGDIRRGSYAVTTILTILPGLKPYRWMIESRWGKKGTNIFYKGFKKYRKCRNCR